MSLSVAIKAILLGFTAFIFGHFVIKNANESSIESRGYDLARPAKLIYAITIILIFLVEMIFPHAWGLYLVLMIAIGILQLFNKEGRERKSSWNNLAIIVFLCGFYSFFAQLDVAGALESFDPSRLNFKPLGWLTLAAIFEIVAGLVKVYILEREVDKPEKIRCNAERKAIVLVTILFVLTVVAAIRVGVWALS